jgi:hypothetical protein
MMIPPEACYRPLYPEDYDQGDPYLLSLPASAGARFRYYVYVTGENARWGRAFRVYASHDLLHWEALGAALIADVRRAHWAPCVRYVPGLERPYDMLYALLARCRPGRGGAHWPHDPARREHRS